MFLHTQCVSLSIECFCCCCFVTGDIGVFIVFLNTFALLRNDITTLGLFCELCRKPEKFVEFDRNISLLPSKIVVV